MPNTCIAMKPFILLLSFLLFSSCVLDEGALDGSWQAVDLFENGRKSELPLQDVSLDFDVAQHYYRFTSSGQYEESGPFKCSAQYLFFTDTTRQPPMEHIVKVLFLSSDTLKMKMQRDSIEQVLFFARKGADSN